MNDQLKHILEQQLRDAHIPDAVTWWPLAIGWWLLIALIIIASIVGIAKLIKHRRLNAYKKSAALELNRLFLDWQTNQNHAAYLQAANSIIKRACSHISLNSASLSGQAWINHINKFTKTDLSSDTQAALTDQLYRKNPAANINNVHAELRSWLVNHRAQNSNKRVLRKTSEAEHA